MPLSAIRSRLPEPPPEGIEAILGPTNTGKTHVALERMVRYESGMIGLPLRLLAREVYDRLTARVGEQQVALITGEERRHPPGARYLVCTVEAMPLERRVEFVAVDEIQLVGDKGRGHIFTDRVLHARGTRATLFLGSDSVATAVRALVPDALITTQARLSRLTYAGYSKLGSLAPGTAIVAFSAESVYALADRARRKHGGCAVVLGALSPRTRNAQVAMYQSGEVPVLVATDAIGMGLNLDITHIAFAEGHKFDGERVRALQVGEIAQIAGRAGRYRTDGTFGATELYEGVPQSHVTAIEAYRIPSVNRLYWRESDLDYTSLATLERSLLQPPPIQRDGPTRFERRADDDDELAFLLLARHPEVRARATHPNAVRLLWDVCRTPNYRHNLPEQHAELLLRVYLRLAEHGTMAEGWVRRSMETLDRVDTAGPAPGERDDRPSPNGIDTLTQRLASIRTWSYLSQRVDWVDGAAALQQFAIEVENRLSDALHAELQARFVDRRATASTGGQPASADGDSAQVRLGGRVVGSFEGLSFRSLDATVPPGARPTVEIGVAARAAALLADPHSAFVLAPDLCLHWRGQPVARLLAGPVAAEPRLRLLPTEWLRPSDRMLVERRLVALLADKVGEVMAPLRTTPREAAGVAYLLEAGLGTVPIERVADARAGLADVGRRALAKAGVRFGARWAYSIAMTGEGRAILAALLAGLDVVPAPGDGDVVRATGASAFWPLAGMVRWGDHAVRVELYEAWTAEVRGLARAGSFRVPEVLLARLGDPTAALREIGMMPVRSVEPAGLWTRRPR